MERIQTFLVKMTIHHYITPLAERILKLCDCC